MIAKYPFWIFMKFVQKVFQNRNLRFSNGYAGLIVYLFVYGHILRRTVESIEVWLRDLILHKHFFGGLLPDQKIARIGRGLADEIFSPMYAFPHLLLKFAVTAPPPNKIGMNSARPSQRYIGKGTQLHGSTYGTNCQRK
jgi:hypothetical protein